MAVEKGEGARNGREIDEIGNSSAENTQRSQIYYWYCYCGTKGGYSYHTKCFYINAQEGV